MEFRFKDGAKEKFKEEFGGKNIRIFLSKKSWMGVAFDWVQDEPKEDDTVIEVEGANIILDSKIMEKTPYMNIDYAEQGDWGADFIINYFKH